MRIFFNGMFFETSHENESKSSDTRGITICKKVEKDALSEILKHKEKEFQWEFCKIKNKIK